MTSRTPRNAAELFKEAMLKPTAVMQPPSPTKPQGLHPNSPSALSLTPDARYNDMSLNLSHKRSGSFGTSLRMPSPTRATVVPSDEEDEILFTREATVQSRRDDGVSEGVDGAPRRRVTPRNDMDDEEEVGIGNGAVVNGGAPAPSLLERLSRDGMSGSFGRKSLFRHTRRGSAVNLLAQPSRGDSMEKGETSSLTLCM